MRTRRIMRLLFAGTCMLAASALAQPVNPPVTRVWVPTGDMKIARGGHTATLLKDGKVLVAGGNATVPCYSYGQCIVALDSAELYDPATGTWRQVASMHVPRQGQTASLLGNGQVLVIGGEAGAATTAEAYDPIADRWSPADIRIAARYGFVAVSLRNGKVLVAGGGVVLGTSISDATIQNLGVAGIYEPAIDNFKEVGPMHERSGATATVLSDGKVLVAGGGYETAYDPCCGPAGYSLATVDIFDPATETWRSAAPLHEARWSPTSALLPDGKVLIVSGIGDYGAEIYDPVTGTSLPAASAGSGYDTSNVVSATPLPGGEVLVIGLGDVQFPANTQIYDPADGRWRTIGRPANGLATTTLLADGRVLASGGSPYGGASAKAELLAGPGAAVEYYHAALDHYFVTASQAEIAALDSGQPPGWTRTRYAFPVWLSRDPPAPADLQDVCRIRIPPGKGDSHFFSASAGECTASLANIPELTLETASAFLATLPDAITGACPSTQVPVYRLWNTRADSNHRYTASPAVRDEMLARGYVPEGYGPDAVAFCAGGN